MICFQCQGKAVIHFENGSVECTHCHGTGYEQESVISFPPTSAARSTSDRTVDWSNLLRTFDGYSSDGEPHLKVELLRQITYDKTTKYRLFLITLPDGYQRIAKQEILDTINTNLIQEVEFESCGHSDCECMPSYHFIENDMIATTADPGIATVSTPSSTIQQAIYLAVQYGGIDGEHHKAWVIDQMVRVLAGNDYATIVANAKSGGDGADTYDWNEGIAP